MSDLDLGRAVEAARDRILKLKRRHAELEQEIREARIAKHAAKIAWERREFGRRVPEWLFRELGASDLGLWRATTLERDDMPDDALTWCQSPRCWLRQQRESLPDELTLYTLTDLDVVVDTMGLCHECIDRVDRAAFVRAHADPRLQMDDVWLSTRLMSPESVARLDAHERHFFDEMCACPEDQELDPEPLLTCSRCFRPHVRFEPCPKCASRRIYLRRGCELGCRQCDATPLALVPVQDGAK